jgi:hypothetical protein
MTFINHLPNQLIMKNYLLIILLAIAFSIGIKAQVFNTSSTLKQGQFSAGFEPGIYISGVNDFNLFLHAGAGITQSIDFGIRLGLMGDNVYLGGDVEFTIGKHFSVSAGAHSWGNFGLDATGLFTFPIASKAKIFTGLDADIILAEGNTQFPLLLPIGIEIPLKKYILFIFETEIRLTHDGQHFIGGGLNFLF